MKTLYKYLLAAFLLGGYTQANSQVLVSYDFENPPTMNPSTAPTSVSAGVTAPNVIANGVTASVLHPGTNGSSPDSTFYSYHSFGWPTQPVPNQPASGTATLNTGKYYEYTVTANSGCTINVQGIQVNYRAVNGPYEGLGGSAYYEMRTSYDGFMTSLNRGGFGPVTTADANYNAGTFTATGNTTPPSPFGVAGLSTLTFRFYYYNLTSSTAEIEMDKVRIVGRVTCPAAMPVEFASFDGKAAGSRVQLSWSTSLERNADHFEVERSQNATEFGSIGQVKAAGDATQKQFYGFTDEQPLLGINYYRLRQVDKDGSVQHSKIIAIANNPDAPAIVVLGNPTENGRINLQLYNVEASKLQLTDMGGRSVPFRLTESAGGAATLEATGTLSSGIYLIRAAQVPAVKVIVR